MVVDVAFGHAGLETIDSHRQRRRASLAVEVEIAEPGFDLSGQLQARPSCGYAGAKPGSLSTMAEYASIAAR